MSERFEFKRDAAGKPDLSEEALSEMAASTTGVFDELPESVVLQAETHLCALTREEAKANRVPFHVAAANVVRMRPNLARIARADKVRP